MIFILVGFLIILYSWKNYKKSFLLYLVYKTVLVTNITIISVPGIPLLSLEIFLDIYFAVFFFVFRKDRSKAMDFQLKIPAIALFVSLLFSSLLGVAGFAKEASSLVREVLRKIILVYSIWCVVESKEDFSFLYRMISLVIFFSCVYGIYEYITGTNPISDYEQTLNGDPSKTIAWDSLDSSRGRRIKSFFEHTIGAGCNWALYASFSFVLFVKQDVRVKSALFYAPCTLLSIVCCLLTFSRTPLFLLMLVSLGALGWKTKRERIVTSVFISSVFALFLLLLHPSFNSFLSDRFVGGSSFELRLSQLSHAFSLLRVSPLYGLGEKYSSEMFNLDIYGLYGSESVWISTPVSYGLLGVTSTIIWAYYCLVLLPLKYKKGSLFFLSLGFWAAITVSSLPGFHEYLFYLCFFYLLKSPGKYESQKTIDGGGRLRIVPSF